MSNEVNTPVASDIPPKLVFVGRYAILDEHELPATTKRAKLVVDKAKLQRISDNNNKRVKDTGDKTPLVIGHTEDDIPEIQQPEIVGLADNFAVEPFFNTGKAAIFADFYIYETKVQLAREYPRRSVELWATREEIDPISLLGATTPERDLGLMQFSRTDELPYIYSITDKQEMPTEDKKKDDTEPKKDDKKDDKKSASDSNPQDVAMDATVAAIFQSKPMQELINSINQNKQANDKIMQILDALEQEDAQNQQQAAQPAPPNSQPPVDQNAAKDNEPPPVKFESSSPSGSNTSVISDNQDQDQYSRKEEKVMAEKVVETEKDTDVLVRLSRLESDHKTLIEENKQLTEKLEETKLQYRKDSAKALMAQLKTENYVFHDEESELKLMEDLSLEAQKIHYQRVKDNYKQEKKAPASESVGQVLKFGRVANGNSAGPQTKEEMQKVAADAAKHGISYEDALEKTYGKK